MYDLISIGHIGIDLFFQGKSLTFENERFQLAVGGKYPADYLYESVGGGGANVAIGGAKNGLKTAVIGKIGENPFKHVILNEFLESDVSTELLQLEKDFISLSSILLAPDGEKSVITYSPIHEHIIRDDTDLEPLTMAKAIYLGNLPDVPIEERALILDKISKNNVLTILNLGVRDCRLELNKLDSLLNDAKVLILNSHEFCDLVKTKYEELNFRENILKNYPFLQEKIVIVTDGKKGSYGYENGNVYFQEAVVPSRILDTTGCGDAYVSAFIAQYLKTKNVAESMKKGAAYASNILSQVGAN